MNNPKYTFYVGPRINPYKLAVIEGERWNPETGEIEVDTAKKYVSTPGLCALTSSDLFIDIIFLEDDSFINFYDKDENFIASSPLKNASKTIYHIQEGRNIAYFTISFSKYEDYLQAYIREPETAADTKIYLDFIYEICEVFPIYKNLSKSYEKESGQELFREKLEGNVTLHKKDFYNVEKHPFDTRFCFVVFKHYTRSPYFVAHFNKVDCEFDLAKYSCKVKFDDKDKASAILDKADNTYNLLKLGVGVTPIRLSQRPLLQLYIAGSNYVTSIISNTYWQTEVTEPKTDIYELNNKFRFTKMTSVGEFIFKGGSVADGAFVEGLVDQFSGNFDNTLSMVSAKSYLRCALVKIASYGDSFNNHPYQKYKTVSGLHTREVIKSYTEAIQHTVWAKDVYAMRVYITASNPIYSEDEYWFEANTLFYLDDNVSLALGAGDPITFVEKVEGAMTGVVDNIFTNDIYGRVICNVDSAVKPDGSDYTLYDIPEDDFVSDNRNYKKCLGVSASYGSFITAVANSVVPTPYGINDEGLYFSKPISLVSTGRVIPLDKSMWGAASYWYVISESQQVTDTAFLKKYTLKDVHPIARVISALLKKVAPGLIHAGTPQYSQFLYSDSNPVYGKKFSLYLTQKTNILAGDYDQAAQKAEISFNSVMNMLRDCFRCYWFIEGNMLRIEHISWFLNGRSYGQIAAPIGLHLSNTREQFNKKPSLFFQGAVAYNIKDLPQRYEFEMMDEQSEPFSGIALDVKADYLNKTERISLADFSADVDFMLTYPEKFGEDGFALLATDSNGEVPILPIFAKDDNGAEYTTYIQNGYMSWLYLLNFYMYDMPGYNLECDSTNALSVKSLAVYKEHDVEIPLENDPDLYMSVQTPLGRGQITKVEIDLNTRMTKLSLRYRLS